jgi:hypothetical protein
MVSSLNAKREPSTEAAPGADSKSQLTVPPSRPLQEGPWRQSELAAQFDAPANRDALLYGVLRLLERVVPRRAMLVVARDQIRAFDGEGFSLAPGQAASFNLTIREDSPLAKAVKGDGPIVGSPSDLGLISWYSFTGQAQPSSVCLAPIAIQGRTALLILADPGSQPLDHGIVPWVVVLARRTSAALAALIANQKRSGSNAPTGALPAVNATPQLEPSAPTEEVVAPAPADTPSAPTEEVVAPAPADTPSAPTEDFPACDNSPEPSVVHQQDAVWADSAPADTESNGVSHEAAGESVQVAAPEEASEPPQWQTEPASREVEDADVPSVWSAHDEPTVEVQVCAAALPWDMDMDATGVFASTNSSEFDQVQITRVVEHGMSPEYESACTDDAPVAAPADESPSAPIDQPSESAPVAAPADESPSAPIDQPSESAPVAAPADESPSAPIDQPSESGSEVDDSALQIANRARTRNCLTEFPLVVDEVSALPTSERVAQAPPAVEPIAQSAMEPTSLQSDRRNESSPYTTGEDRFTDSALDAFEQSDSGALVSGFPDLDVDVPMPGNAASERAEHASSNSSTGSSVQVWTASQIGLEALNASSIRPQHTVSEQGLAAQVIPPSADASLSRTQHDPSAQAQAPRAYDVTMDASELASAYPRTASMSPLVSSDTLPDPLNVPHSSAQSATLLYPAPQNTLHVSPSGAAPLAQPAGAPHAPSSSERAELSLQHTPISSTAAHEIPAAGGLHVGDPELRGHVARLPDEQVMELLNSGVAAYQEVAFAVLVERGAAAHPALLSSFPHPVNGRRRELVASGQPLEEHGPVIWLVNLHLRDLIDSLRPFLTHPDADHRYYATALLFRANDQHSLGKVAELLYDPDDQVRAAAMRYVETWRQNNAVDSVLAVVRRHLRDNDPRNLTISAAAAAELRDITAIPALIEFLDHPSENLRRRAQTSLVRLTFQELGGDRRAWEKWYKKAAATRRDRWLLDAMVDRDIRVRENAAREIRSIPRLVVNYNPDFDLRGQQTAQRTVEHFLSLRRGQF